MFPRVEIEFAGQTRSVELQDASEATWQSICRCAEAVSGLKQYAIRYEDERGDLCRLSKETLEDLMWIARGSPTRMKLVVRQDEDQRFDELHTMLLQHLRASSDRKPAAATVEKASSSSLELSESSTNDEVVQKPSVHKTAVSGSVRKASTKMKRNLDDMSGRRQPPFAEPEEAVASFKFPWKRVALPLAIAIWQFCFGDYAFFLGAFSLALVYYTSTLVAPAKSHQRTKHHPLEFLRSQGGRFSPFGECSVRPEGAEKDSAFRAGANTAA